MSPDADLLPALHREMAGHGGPDGPFVGHPIERYLLAERELGRVATDADCRAAASLVVSVCHDRAFQRFFHAGHHPSGLGVGSSPGSGIRGSFGTLGWAHRAVTDPEHPK